MKQLARRAGVLTLVALFLVVPGLWALGECGPSISSSSSDSPLTGELKGQRMVTTTRTSSFQSSLTGKIVGGSYSLTNTTTTVYWVGVYQMSDGTTREVRCDTYRYA